MASLSSMIRRSASAFGPLALQALRTKRHYTRVALAAKFTHVNDNNNNSNNEGHSLVQRFGFSSESTKRGSDESLLRVLDEEISSAKDSDEHSLVDELPRGFPFKIQDNPGQQTITLKRTYQDEDIKVIVHMPSLVTGEENDIDDDDQDSEKDLQSSIPLVITVSKKTGDSSLEFLCTAYNDEIAIESLSVKSIGNTDDQIAYEGPDFSDLDENLQKSFLKYLEIRGIKPSTTSFLHEYMIDKDNSEYMSWLQKVKKFIEA